MKSVDRFFKDKLENHSITPSENAWARVEAGLSKKNNVVVWRWAAAILLLGALMSVVYWSQIAGDAQQKVLAKKTTAPSATNSEKATQQKGEVIKTSGNHSNTPAKLQKPIIKQKTFEQPKPSGAKEKMLETETALAQQYAINLKREEAIQGAPVVVREDTNQDGENVIKEEKLKVEATPKREVASSKQKPIKLEFTLEALSSEETVATINEAKPTGIRKVLNLAREMKQGEGPVTNLRDKKDELFAHNFLTKKEKNQ